ncbi:MAG: SGNH/GDSL hydrolase family protein, partial [Agathobacter sp.]|nr:SGNH/GDSL hydrolase family protein [Agathobacter sp.]
YEQWDEQVSKFAQENDVDYINYIPLQDDIGLDMSKDTYDAGLHLNTDGAEKMADYFGKYLVENYELNDYRSDPKYESIWNEKIAMYDDMKQQQYDELEKYGELKSFGANAIQK